MQDGDCAPDDSLPPADRAVKYLLDRIQHDADLRWLMLGTEAFALLCEAEAARTGETPVEVNRRRAHWLAPGGTRPGPRIPRYERLLEANDIDYRP